MDYINLEIDFIERTLEVIKQYKILLKENPHIESFDITIYINSLTGLIVLPKETGFLDKFLPNDRLENWGIKKCVLNPDIKTIKELAIQLRHCIAHFDIEFGSDDERQIDKLIFKDSLKAKGTIAEFGTGDFKIFVELLADVMIKNAKRRNLD